MFCYLLSSLHLSIDEKGGKSIGAIGSRLSSFEMFVTSLTSDLFLLLSVGSLKSVLEGEFSIEGSLRCLVG